MRGLQGTFIERFSIWFRERLVESEAIISDAKDTNGLEQWWRHDRPDGHVIEKAREGHRTPSCRMVTGQNVRWGKHAAAVSYVVRAVSGQPAEGVAIVCSLLSLCL